MRISLCINCIYPLYPGFCSDDVHVIVQDSELISSPLHPSFYPYNLDCVWIIQRSNKLHTHLRFLHVNIDDDRLAFGFGSFVSVLSTVMEITGYNVKPQSLTLNTTYVWAKFTSNAIGQNDGFLINVTTLEEYGKSS